MKLAIATLIVFLVVDAIMFLAWFQDKKKKKRENKRIEEQSRIK
jgi:uncharacterized membrane protein YsdA (DUF1294 family)